MNMVGIENGYEIVDGGPEVMSASQSMLAGAVSITARGRDRRRGDGACDASEHARGR